MLTILSRPDKLLWPAEGVTKRLYLDYLDAVSGRMLPWVRDRPLTLVPAPDHGGQPTLIPAPIARRRRPGRGPAPRLGARPISP
jgi:DNA primase